MNQNTWSVRIISAVRLKMATFLSFGLSKGLYVARYAIMAIDANCWRNIWPESNGTCAEAAMKRR